MMRVRWILLILVMVFALGHLSGQLLRWFSPATQPVAAAPLPDPGVPGNTVPGDRFGERERRNIEIFRDVSPSVVYISNIALRRDFFFNVFEIPQGTGSGFVWDEDGHIVTNYHVIQGGRRFGVVLADQSEWDAELVGTAPNKDLAVLRIDAPRDVLEPVRPGTSSDLLVGQEVLAIGNPFGLDHSLSVGVVSALGRELDSPGGFTIRDVIQTDTAINPGNSGGPLLDSAGRLIGVNAAIISPTGASAGIGFAVPVDTVRRLVPQLIRYGQPIQPGIGVELVQDRVARRLGIGGVIVYQTRGGGPAERAGIEGLRYSRRGRPTVGDVFVAVDGEPVSTVEDMVLAFEDAGVGASVRITVERDGERRDVDVELIAVQ